MQDRSDRRDRRLDCLRGIALIVVLIDHIEAHAPTSPLRDWAPRSICFFDCAEVFVFLSGLAFGYVCSYGPRNKSLRALTYRAIRRSLQIYVTYLLVAWAAVYIAANGEYLSPPLQRMLLLGTNASACFQSSLFLGYQPYGLEILPLYVVVLPLLPALYLSCSRYPLSSCLLSVTIYIAAQLSKFVAIKSGDNCAQWHFDPFAWQLLFCLGLNWYSRGSQKAKIHFVPSVVALCVCMFGIGLRVYLSQICAAKGSEASKLLDWAFLMDKHSLGPLRLIHFTSLAYVLSAILPPSRSAIWDFSVMRAIELCGRQSLSVYPLGVVLAWLTIPVFQRIESSVGFILLVDIDCCLISVIIASCIEYVTRFFVLDVQLGSQKSLQPADAC